MLYPLFQVIFLVHRHGQQFRKGISVGEVRKTESDQGQQELILFHRLAENSFLLAFSDDIPDLHQSRIPGILEITFPEVSALVQVFPQNEIYISRIIMQKIKMQLDEPFNGLNTIQILRKQLYLLLTKSPIYFNQYSTVQFFLIAEVFINHPFVDVSSIGNLVHPGSRKPFFRKFLLCRLQNILFRPGRIPYHSCGQFNHSPM
jgi:hypothetical protein